MKDCKLMVAPLELNQYIHMQSLILLPRPSPLRDTNAPIVEPGANHFRCSSSLGSLDYLLHIVPESVLLTLHLLIHHCMQELTYLGPPSPKKKLGWQKQ